MAKRTNRRSRAAQGAAPTPETAHGAYYPRRQLRRERWQSLNGTWDFAFDDQARYDAPEQLPGWTHEIQVPFAPECDLSGIGDGGFHCRAWYRRRFQQPRPRQGRVLLHFGAVDYEASVWVNGALAGRHLGGHTPFELDITHLLEAHGDQELIVRADDDPSDLAKPRGKQDWQKEPHSIWYPRTTGIWQTVWLEEVPERHIARLQWTPLLERWEIGCEVFLAGAPRDGQRLRVRLQAGEQLLSDDTYGVVHGEVHRRIALSDPGIDDFRNELLWSPEKPTLIEAELELLEGEAVVDRVRSYTALRSVSAQRGRFLLNGRPYYMRLALDQGYWPESLMTPPTPLATREDVRLAKAAGFNGVRKHQKVEDPEFLYWADKLGLLVWSEMPSAYRFTHASVERLVREWTEVIDRDSNHPCIAVWVPFNESWGVPDLAEKTAHQSCVQALYHLTHTLDVTRPVIGNDGWESTATDILGIHDYDDQPARLLEKYGTHSNLPEILTRRWPGGRMLTVEGYSHDGQPVMLTEFGGIAYVAGERSGKSWGYSVCRSREDLQRRYEELLKAVHHLELFAGFCYTQLTDTFQEANGLFTAEREPKFPLRSMCKATRGSGFTRGELTTAPQPPPLEEHEEGAHHA